MSIKFACDSVPNCEGQIVNRVGSVLVIEGIGVDVGSYFAKASLAHRFPSRKQAEDCAKTLAMDSAETDKKAPNAMTKAEIEAELKDVFYGSMRARALREALKALETKDNS